MASNKKKLPPLHTPSPDTQVIELDFAASHSSRSNSTYVLRELQNLGVDLLLPYESRLTQAMGDFCDYILDANVFESITLPILQKFMEIGDDPPVGELQGGHNDDSDDSSSSIFRVVLPSKPIQELLRVFHKECPCHKNILTEQAMLAYIMQQCNDARHEVHTDLEIKELGNPMLIFGRGNTAPPFGQQIPHIDHCQPNVQVGVYFSRNCPATLIMEASHSIECVQDLLEYWEDEYGSVPTLIQETLWRIQDAPLHTTTQQHFVKQWSVTINQQLSRFGKLFCNISKIFRVTHVAPGTTLLAHDNPIHAGPPFHAARMFAYAIGIPTVNDIDACDAHDNPQHTDNNDKNDGEIQYNQVLLHVDLCCILFAEWEYNNTYSNQDEIQTAKRYLLEMLPAMIRAFPYENFQRLLPDDRAALRQWLYDLWHAVVVVVENGNNGDNNASSMECVIDMAVSNTARIFG